MGGGAYDATSYPGAGVTVNIRCSNGSKFSVQAELDSTVGDFKDAVAGTSGVAKEQQRLIYKGRILKDDQTLASYGVEGDHTIHLVRGSVPPASPSPPNTGANLGASTVLNGSNQDSSRGLGSGESGGLGTAGLGGSLIPGLGALEGNGPSGLYGAGLPELDQMQQQLAQNPNMMRDIMNMPVVQNLMNNPDLMRNLIMNNPQMCEIIDRNPDLGHILNDPSILRQTLEAARNPELMREMMRNTDRAMSNIESSPEGFNMLRRMYENVQEPFLNATTMAADSGNRMASNPFAALFGNQGSTRSGDQPANASTTGSESANGTPAPNTNPLPNPWGAAGGGQTNSARPAAPAADARGTGIAGLGGLGLPNLDQTLAGLQGSSPLIQAMENPAVSQMMQSILSNPQYMNQILNNFDPNNMLGLNSQFREMLQNPEFLQQLTSPETLRQLRAVQESLSSLGVGRQSDQTGAAGTGMGGTGTPSGMGLEFLMNIFNGGLGTGGFASPNISNVPPEELYATQLSQLQEMGFFDIQENIRALSATAGNVHAAVERLLGNLG